MRTAQEAARVRARIEERAGPDARHLLAEVDGIVKREAEFAARQADLEELSGVPGSRMRWPPPAIAVG